MKIIRKIINLFYRRRDSRLSKKQINKLMVEVRNAFPQDHADYDGMGNYRR